MSDYEPEALPPDMMTRKDPVALLGHRIDEVEYRSEVVNVNFTIEIKLCGGLDEHRQKLSQIQDIVAEWNKGTGAQ